MSWLLADIAFGPPLPPSSPDDKGEAIGLIVSGILIAIASISAILLRKKNPRVTIASTVVAGIAILLTVVIWERFRGREQAFKQRQDFYDKLVDQYRSEAERLRNSPPRDKDEDR